MNRRSGRPATNIIAIVVNTTSVAVPRSGCSRMSRIGSARKAPAGQIAAQRASSRGGT